MTRDEALRVLGLNQGASLEEVKIAHRELAQMLHPDKYGDNAKLRARAEQQMKAVNEAYTVLTERVSGARGSSASRGTSGSYAGRSQAYRRGRGPSAGSRSATGSQAGADGGTTGSRRAAGSASPAQIAFEAEARARAAETARLTVAAQARTMRERRSGMVGMSAVAALVMLVTMRMGGMLGTLAFSISSMLVVWGIVDAVMLSQQVKVLQKRNRELMGVRDEALEIAERARKL